MRTIADGYQLAHVDLPLSTVIACAGPRDAATPSNKATGAGRLRPTIESAAAIARCRRRQLDSPVAPGGAQSAGGAGLAGGPLRSAPPRMIFSKRRVIDLPPDGVTSMLLGIASLSTRSSDYVPSRASLGVHLTR